MKHGVRIEGQSSEVRRTNPNIMVLTLYDNHMNYMGRAEVPLIPSFVDIEAEVGGKPTYVRMRAGGVEDTAEIENQKPYMDKHDIFSIAGLSIEFPEMHLRIW